MLVRVNSVLFSAHSLWAQRKAIYPRRGARVLQSPSFHRTPNRRARRTIQPRYLTLKVSIQHGFELYENTQKRDKVEQKGDEKAEHTLGLWAFWGDFSLKIGRLCVFLRKYWIVHFTCVQFLVIIIPLWVSHSQKCKAQAMTSSFSMHCMEK